MRILIYDDSPVFGGHEVMTLLAVEAMASQTDWELHFLATAANDRLLERLDELEKLYPALTVSRIPNAFHRLQGILNHLQRRGQTKLARRFADIAPDLALIIQGDIEISSTGLIAARRAGIPAVSYIPLPHNQVEKGGKFAAMRDVFARHLYRVPDGFITISTVLAEMLRGKGATAPIKVVYNGIATESFTQIDQIEARRILKLPEIAPVIGIAGRLERKQKQQHLLIEAIAEPSAQIVEWHAVLCGDGQDRDNLEELASSLSVRERTHFLEWRSDLATFYSALDVLAIPSRYEGVPLVMLEALCCGTPVIAGNRDGMKELLPSEWLFEPGNPAGFRKAITTVLSNRDATRERVAGLQDHIRQSMTVDTFGKSFTHTIAELCMKLSKVDT